MAKDKKKDDEDEKARKVRAESLRDQIRKLREGSRPQRKPASPREFLDQAAEEERARRKPRQDGPK